MNSPVFNLITDFLCLAGLFAMVGGYSYAVASCLEWFGKRKSR